jgi:opacity protein-like surface antigen
MKIKTFAALMAALSLPATVASAAHAWEDPSGWWDNHFEIANSRTKLFRAKEITLDLCAGYTAQERGIEDVFETNIRKNDNPGAWWGGGVGLNYFMTRHIGLGVDVNIPNNDGNFIDSVNASVYLRLPWEAAGFAPYIFGGGGRMTEPTWQWSIHAGVGLEFRFNPITGIFADARYVWADDAQPNGYKGKYDGDNLVLRAGLRLAF